MDKLNLVQGDQKAVYELSLEEFQEVYRHVARLCQDQNKKIGETHILLLTENALIKFSISKIVIQINHKKNLSRKDFDVVISPKFEGNVKPITWRAFIWTELVHNWWILISVSLLFYFLFYANNNFSGISTINQLLIESNSLFISIFVLFTISQNRDITSSAISSLVLAFISSSILTLPTNITISIPVINFSFFRATIAIALTHIALLILLDCFIAITNYYLKVMRTALESKMFVQLMDEHSEDENK
jgi:hypothetical protein